MQAGIGNTLTSGMRIGNTSCLPPKDDGGENDVKAKLHGMDYVAEYCQYAWCIGLAGGRG